MSVSLAVLLCQCSRPGTPAVIGNELILVIISILQFLEVFATRLSERGERQPGARPPFWEMVVCACALVREPWTPARHRRIGAHHRARLLLSPGQLLLPQRDPYGQAGRHTGALDGRALPVIAPIIIRITFSSQNW